jgi:hypothetical protein
MEYSARLSELEKQFMRLNGKSNSCYNYNTFIIQAVSGPRQDTRDLDYTAAPTIHHHRVTDGRGKACLPANRRFLERVVRAGVANWRLSCGCRASLTATCRACAP